MSYKLTNEDGTDFNPPNNPLSEKWNKLITRNGKPCPFKDNAITYACLSCSEKSCYHTSYFTIPEEDKKNI